MTDKVIAFTVVKHLPIGLKVQLRDGRTGIIRIRETSWRAEDRQRWQELYPLEWSSQAVLIDDYERLELSLRLAENDPWEHVPGRYKRGQVVKGIVTGVVTYGVFVEISTGVRGLLHTSQFPKEVGQGALEIFWPGDHVLAKVLHIDVKLRRISLGLARPQPTIDHPGEDSGYQKRKPSPLRPVEEPPSHMSLERFLGSDSPRHHILVIEDDREQATAISTWLQKIEQRVDLAYCGRDGLALLEKEIPDIVLVDLGLPDMSGIEVIRQVHQCWPVTRCVLATDWARADEHSAELEDLQSLGVIFLLKPLLPDDLVDMLLEIGGGEKQSSDRELQLALREELSTTDLTKRPLHKSIRILLEQCHRQLGFDAATLFALDTVQRTVQIIESHGDGLINLRALPSLIYSPVRDVAEDRDQVVITELREKDRGRFQYLLEFYPLVACIGMPVPSGVAIRHALMLLDNHPRAISEGGMAYVEAVALVIGALLDRQTAQEKAILVQRTTLLGHLTRGLVHEINHRISGLYTRLGKLEDSLEKINRSISAGKDTETGISDASANLSSIRETIEAIVKTTRQLGNIAKRPKDEFLRLDELAQNALNLLKDTSDRAKVRVSIIPPEKLIVLRSQGTAIEQVLINVILNAIQQIEESHACKDGWVQICFEAHDSPESADISRIIIQDNGPGVHARQWEQIFEVGFSTREEGSGMGLYISRSLMESLGGRLYVAESYILGGTTFVLELPHQF